MSSRGAIASVVGMVIAFGGGTASAQSGTAAWSAVSRRRRRSLHAFRSTVTVTG